MERPFGPYRLVQQIAVGGMAEIHLAKTHGIAGFEKYVALKMIHPNFSQDQQFIQMLIDEAKITVQLQHVNIAQTFDLGRVGDIYYITLEYVDGADLYKLLRKSAELDKEIPIAVGAHIAKEVASGLDYAHRKRDHAGQPLAIVHRDVSPQNVLISYAGEVKLVDFGIAKATSRARQTAVGVIKGKYYYMSPEQAWGEQLDHRTDIFSTGILLYETLTGQMLYLEEDLHKLLDMVRRADIPPPTTLRKEVPRELERIVMRALAKRPEDRYQNAADMANDLERFLHGHAPVFTAGRVASWLTEVLGGTASPTLIGLEEQEREKAAAEEARQRGDTRRFTRDQLVLARSDFTDENSIIYSFSDQSRPGDDDGTGAGTDPRLGSRAFDLGELTGSIDVPDVGHTRDLATGDLMEASRDDADDDDDGRPDDSTFDEPVDDDAPDDPTPLPPPMPSLMKFTGEFAVVDDVLDPPTMQRMAAPEGRPGRSSTQPPQRGRAGTAPPLPLAAPPQPPSAPGPATIQRAQTARGADEHTRQLRDASQIAPPAPKPKAASAPQPSPPAPEPAPRPLPPVSRKRQVDFDPDSEAGSVDEATVISDPPGFEAVPADLTQIGGPPGMGGGATEITQAPPPRGMHDSTGDADLEADTLLKGAPVRRPAGQPPPAWEAAPALSARVPQPAISELRPPRQSRRTPASGIATLDTPTPESGPGALQALLSPDGSRMPLVALSPLTPTHPNHAPPMGAPYPTPGPGPLSGPFTTRQIQNSLDVDEIPDKYKIRRRAQVSPLLIAVGAFVLAAAVAGILIAIYGPSDETPAGGADSAIEIVSTPPGASVTVDGKPLDAPTPVTFQGKAGVSYLIRLDLPRHQRWEREHVVPPEGGAQKVVARLDPIVVKLWVETAPEGADVFINGTPVGRTPIELAGLDPQTTRTVEVRLKGYRPVRRTLDWSRETEKRLSFELEP
ncbi:MAG TPA: serine/threonine-protein kinase [Kofleriaceae bacterium]|nr:serine/threonine-protein kinase [Kofleriaceae bacterium]